MNDKEKEPYGDAITYPFWEAAEQHKLMIQHCPECGSYQFYPRPFCLACNAGKVEWVETKGDATIYSMTTVRLQIAPQLNPPYVAAVIELDEGPRMLTNIEGGSPSIGDRVKLTWRERDDEPPVPIWVPVNS